MSRKQKNRRVSAVLVAEQRAKRRTAKEELRRTAAELLDAEEPLDESLVREGRWDLLSRSHYQ